MIVDAETLDRILWLAEDAVDAAEAEAARLELVAGADPIPWQQAKADLGLA